MAQEKSREHYISLISEGNIVAFKHEEAMFSGKVEGKEGDKFIVKTRNCSVYFVEPDDIVWVKNGTHWPIGIYNALKVSKGQMK